MLFRSQGKDVQKVPEMTDAFVNQVTDRYIELYEHITGDKFQKAEGTDVLKRIEQNILNFLKK